MSAKDACPGCGGEKVRKSRLCADCRRRSQSSLRVVTEEGCLLRPSTISSATRKRNYRAAWERVHGPLGEGLVLHHDTDLCPNGHLGCERVEHMESMSASDHSRLHHPRRSVCARGHVEAWKPNGSTRTGVTKRTCAACVRERERDRRRLRTQTRRLAAVA